MIQGKDGESVGIVEGWTGCKVDHELFFSVAAKATRLGDVV